MSDLITELKRRDVIRVTLAYAFVGWILIEAGSVLIPTFGGPDWLFRNFALLVILGLPITIVLAWVFEITPDGIKWQKDLDRSPSITHPTAHHTSRKLNFFIIATLVVALAISVSLNLTGRRVSDVATSIAVLPFASQSTVAENVLFADGIHDDLLTTLANIAALKVISRTSVLGYRDTTMAIPEIADELGVATILEGTVQRIGNNVRINVQLIDAERDDHLWAQSFDRELTIDNIFAIQKEIAESIASALRAELSLEEQQRLGAQRTDNLQAYQAYLLGRQNMSKRISTDLEEAKIQFERAIELDPDYVLAYVGLADTYGHLARYGSLAPEDANTLAKPLVDRALELDDQSGEAYTSLGSIFRGQNDNAAAEKAYQRAIELNPNYADAYHYYAYMLMFTGRPDEALVLRQKGLELDPMSMLMNLNMGLNLMALGRFDEAWEAHQRTLRIAPDAPIVYTLLGFFEYFVNGNLAEGIRHTREAARLDPGDAGHAGSLSMLYVAIGDLNNAHAWLERTRELNPDNVSGVIAAVLINVHEDWTEAVRHSRRLLILNPGVRFSLPVLAWEDARKGTHELALARYREAAPELFTDEPDVTAANYLHAIEVASLLIGTGEHARAEQLLDGGLAVIQDMPRFGITGYGFSDVVIHTLKGDTNQALAVLRKVVDENLRGWWRFSVEKNPHLEPLHDDPRYQEIIAELEADMAAQLASLEESNAGSL